MRIVEDWRLVPGPDPAAPGTSKSALAAAGAGPDLAVEGVEQTAEAAP